MKDTMTIGERYNPAMEITDQLAADAYFDELVARAMRLQNISREDAEIQERRNLGYYAGYFKSQTRARVETLFRCSHPVFGEIKVNGSPHEKHARRLGREEGTRQKYGERPSS